jgi:hypothetical protein
MRQYAWAILVVAGVFETGFFDRAEVLGRVYAAVAVGSDGNHDCAELGPSGSGDAESAAGHGVCGMDRNWRGGYSGAGHCVVWGVCGLEQAGLPGADRYGNSRAEVFW